MWPNQQKQECFASYSINKNWIPSFLILITDLLKNIAKNDLKFVKNWAKNCPVGFHQMPPSRTKCSKFSQGRSPKPPLREGVDPLSSVLSPTHASGTRPMPQGEGERSDLVAITTRTPDPEVGWFEPHSGQTVLCP